MYHICKTSYGYKIEFNEFSSYKQLEKLSNEVSKILKKNEKDCFGVLFDMRGSRPLSVKAENIFQNISKMLKASGMRTSVIMYKSPLVENQLLYIADLNGIKTHEKNIDCNQNRKPEEKAIGIIKRELKKTSCL